MRINPEERSSFGNLPTADGLLKEFTQWEDNPIVRDGLKLAMMITWWWDTLPDGELDRLRPIVRAGAHTNYWYMVVSVWSLFKVSAIESHLFVLHCLGKF